MWWPSMIQRTATFSPPSSQGVEQMWWAVKAASGMDPIRPSVWWMMAAWP
jgi:hypothetical protein